MSSKTSAGSPPEYFVDRSLGRVTADRLRAEGWRLHLIADEYPDDAERIDDSEWITEGCLRGWALLTKDKAIRYRAHEIAALAPGGLLFCLAKGGWTIDEMVAAFGAARPAMERAIARGDMGFWHVHKDGTIRRMNGGREAGPPRSAM